MPYFTDNFVSSLSVRAPNGKADWRMFTFLCLFILYNLSAKIASLFTICFFNLLYMRAPPRVHSNSKSTDAIFVV